MTFDWLTARPIAHRGLHDATAGRFENTLSAARLAVDHGFAIECDVQRAADGEAVVFHDFDLDRLTDRRGPVGARASDELATMAVGGSADGIVTLSTLLATIDRRVPLVCEIKSAFDRDLRLADRVFDIVRAYDGPLALKSFDPFVIGHLRATLGVLRPAIPLGVVAEAHYDDPEWEALAPAFKRDLAALAHFGETRPDFLSYSVTDLPHAATSLFRLGLGRPVMTWTVRTAEQRRRAAAWADQMVFEGFVP